VKPAWLTSPEVLALHAEALAEFGGAPGARDLSLLESALAKPLNLMAYGTDISLFDLAAAYCAGIARDHPFVDGNKRTGFLAAAVFLDLNGYELAPPEAEVVATMIQIAEGRFDQVRLSAWFERWASKK